MDMAWIGLASHGRDPGVTPNVSQPMISTLIVGNGKIIEYNSRREVHEAALSFNSHYE